MKKYGLLICILFAAFLSSLAQIPAAASTRFWVQFKDKNNSPYSVANPAAFLSARSIQRRVLKSIPLNSSDLPVNSNYVDSVAAKGAHIHCRSKWLNGVMVYTSSPSVISAIQSLPFVAHTRPVGLAHPSGTGTEKMHVQVSAGNLKTKPGDVLPASLNYGPSLNQINMLQGVCLHDEGFQGQGMVIAVLDAGFLHADTLHIFDSLRNNHQILGTYNFVAESPTAAVYNGHFHGMCVLSCMGGNMPGQLIGTAPKASYWLLVTEDVNAEYPGEEYNWAAGAEYADSVGADVINTSLGYTTFDDSTLNHTYADMNGHTTPNAMAANYAANKGIAVVCAAGNLGATNWRYIGTPADADSVLAVGAVDASGMYANFSSHGPAAGGMVKPAVAAEGQGSVVADWNSNGILLENGTSFASPIMCGLVTCLLQAHPQARPMDLFHFIEQSANQNTSPDTLLGYGKPDFCAANLTMGISGPAPKPGTGLLALSPNPFTEGLDFVFQSGAEQDLTITLYDLSGRILRQVSDKMAPFSNNAFGLHDLSQLGEGMYLLAFQTQSKLIVKKIVKGK